MYRPAVDIEPVGQIAEARGARQADARAGRQIDRDIAAEQREGEEEMAELYRCDEAEPGGRRQPPAQRPLPRHVIEHHPDGEIGQQPAEAAEPVEIARRQPAGEEDERNAEIEQPRGAERQHHEVEIKLEAQRPEGAANHRPDRIVAEEDARQRFVESAHQQIVGEEAPGAGRLEIFTERQGGDAGTDHQDADQQADGEPGIDAQQPRRQEAQRRPAALEALRHQKAAYREEDEDAEEAENALVAAEHDQRLVLLAAFGDQEGMREQYGNRRRETQEVEIFVSRHARSTWVGSRLFRPGLR